MFSAIQFNDVFKKLKTHLGVDAEEGVDDGVGGGEGGDAAFANDAVATPNGVAVDADVNGAVNGTSTGPEENQPRTSAFEGVGWQRVKDRLTGERVKSLFTPSRFSLSAWGAKQPEPEANGDLNLNDPELHKAAVTIQSAFKFYKHSKKSHEENVTPEMHHAAVKIQAAWKFKKMRLNARKRIEQKRAAEQWQRENRRMMRDPQVHRAAVKIQAAWKFKKMRENARRRLAEKRAIERMQHGDQLAMHKAALKIQSAWRFKKFRENTRLRMRARQVGVASKGVAAFSTAGPYHKSPYQSPYPRPDRGRPTNARQRCNVPSNAKCYRPKSQASSLSAAERQEIEEIDLADPALHEAATRIQATFKGHRFRKEAHSQTAHLRAAKAAATMVNNIQDPEEEVDIDLDDPKTAEAAAQIQAAFRGMQIRKKKPLAAAVAAKAQAPVSTNPFAPSPAKTAPAKSAPARAPTRPPAARSAPGREPSVPARTGPPPRPPAASRPPNVPSRPPRPGTSYNRRDGY